MKKLNYAAGLLFVLLLSVFAKELSLWVEPFLQLEALTIAIVLGILYNNLMGTQQKLLPGVNFALKKLLKIGIVLLGFKLNLQVLWALGPKIIILVVGYVATALMLSWGEGSYLRCRLVWQPCLVSGLVFVGHPQWLPWHPVLMLRKRILCWRFPL